MDGCGDIAMIATDLRKLWYFCRIIDAGSMSRAAEGLNLAQPALSKSVQSLETALGVQLFQRSNRGALPTDAALRLYEHAQIVFNQLQRAEIELRDATVRPSGHVVIGMPYSIAVKVAMPLLLAAKERLPDVRLELVEDHSHVLASRLRCGGVNLALMAAQRQLSDIPSMPIVVEELFLLRPRTGPTATIAPITFAEASKLVYVLPSLGNGLRLAAESHFKARSLPLKVAQEIDAISIIPRCVEAGFGCSILPGGCIDAALQERVEVRRFAEGGWHRTLILCQAEKAPPRSVTAAAAELMRTVVHRLIRRGEWEGGRPIEAA